MEMILPHLSAEDIVVDVGCGNGRLAVALLPHVRMSCGLDYSSELITSAREVNPKVLFFVGDANNITAWIELRRQSKLPFFNTIVSNVAIRKDGCKLDRIMPAINRFAQKPTQCFFRIQGECDLPEWLIAPPLYNEEEIRHYIGNSWTISITEETYMQKFTDEIYFRTFLGRINLKARPEMFQQTKAWSLKVQRQYYCVRAEKI